MADIFSQLATEGYTAPEAKVDPFQNFLAGGNKPESAVFDSGKNSSFGDVWQDIKAPLANPELFAANARAGMESGVAGALRFLGNENPEDTSIYGTDQSLIDEGKRIDEAAQALRSGVDQTYTPKTKLGGILKGVSGSSPSTMAGLAASLVGGPVAGYILGGVLGAGNAGFQKTNERLNLGDSQESATGAGVFHGGTEGLSEVIGLGSFVKLFKAAKAGTQLTPAILRETFAEGLEEVSAGIPQGLEDAWRGRGKNPAGLSAMQDHIISGSMFQQAVDDFVGGALMGGGVGVTLIPLQMSYKPMAMEQARALTTLIGEAEVSGVAPVVAGQTVPLETLKAKLADITEAFSIKPADLVAPASQAIEDNKSVEAAAIERLSKKPEAVPEPVAPPVVAEPVAEPNVESAPAEPAMPVETSHRDWAADPVNLESVKNLTLTIPTTINGKTVEMKASSALDLVSNKLSKFEELLRCLKS